MSYYANDWTSLNFLPSPAAPQNIAPAIQNLSAAGAGGVAPGAGAIGGAGTQAPGSGFGFNTSTMNLALGGLGMIGNLWSAWEARKLQQKQFDFQKGVTETNLNNQIKTYNTTLEDRSRARAHIEGQDAATAQSYVDRNRLSR